jgi:hypothetical protein
MFFEDHPLATKRFVDHKNENMIHKPLCGSRMIHKSPS